MSFTNRASPLTRSLELTPLVGVGKFWNGTQLVAPAVAVTTQVDALILDTELELLPLEVELEVRLDVLLTDELELLAEEVRLEDMLLVELLTLLDDPLDALDALLIEVILLELRLEAREELDEVATLDDELTLDAMLELLLLAATLDELTACPPPEHAAVEMHASSIIVP